MRFNPLHAPIHAMIVKDMDGGSIRQVSVQDRLQVVTIARMIVVLHDEVILLRM